jgi:hypothetical protein
MTEQPTAIETADHLTPPVDDGLLRRLAEGEAARILVAAAGAGLVAQLLFVGQRSGINVILWVATVLLVALATRPTDARIDRHDAWLPLAALAFAGFIALRDDGLLLLFNLFAAGWLTLLSAVALGGYPITRSGAAAVAGMAATAAAIAGFGLPLLARGLRPLMRPLAHRGPRFEAVARGLLIGLPLLLVFLALFAAADGIFGAQLAALTRLDLLSPDGTTRLVVAAVAGWLVAGTAACAWLARPTTNAAETQSAGRGWRLGSLEALVVLLLLDAAFVLFVAVQAAYLFGGLDTLAVSGLTYAEYARRGFFELIAVAMLAGLVLLAVGRFVDQRATPVRTAAIALAALTGLVLVSATYRLMLYQGAYGWTELRFHALAAICWLALSLGAAIVTTATARQRWLPVAVLAAALVVAAGVNVLGPKGFVTERNLERAINPALVAPGGHTGLDTYYLRYLGADAVPPMVAARNRLPPEEAFEINLILRSAAVDLRADDRQSGWPSWNLSRHRALEALAAAGY